MQAPALGLAERSEQVLLDLLRSLSSLLEPPAATSGELDEVTATVDGIAAANDELIGLETVDHRHQVARVDAERLTEATLRNRPGLGERMEDGELLWMHAELAEGRTEAYRRCPPQAKDEQVAGARIGVAVEGSFGARGRRAHVVAMVPSDNDWRI